MSSPPPRLRPRSETLTVLVATLVACKPTPTTAPDGGGARPHFDPQAMVGWRCTMIERSSLGLLDEGAQAHPTDSSSVDFTLVAGDTDDMLGLRIDAVETKVPIIGRIVALDRARVVVGSGDDTRSQTPGEHPDIARVIDAATGATNLWVRVDPRARWVQPKGRLDPVVTKMFWRLPTLGRAWLFAYPELPAQLRAGERWEGLRSLPLTGKSQSLRLEYTVTTVAPGHAAIALHHDAESDLPSGRRGRVVVDGIARIRPRDGAFLGATVSMKLEILGGESDFDITWAAESTCEPPR